MECQYGFNGYGTCYIPYSQKGSGFIQYVPVQNTPVANRPDSYSGPNNGPYLPNAPPPNSPFYSIKPTISYQGFDEANALRQAYPNQPIIIINNGGNSNTGENSDKDKNGIDFGELAAIFLAAKAGKRHGGKGRDGPDAPEPHAPVAAPPVVYSYLPPPVAPTPTPQSINTNTDVCSSGNKKTSINITIILPDSGASITVEEQKPKCKNRPKKKKKTKKEVEEEESDYDDDRE